MKRLLNSILWDNYLLAQCTMYVNCSLENNTTKMGVGSEEGLGHEYVGHVPYI